MSRRTFGARDLTPSLNALNSQAFSKDHRSVALMQVSRFLNSTLDLDELLELVIDTAIEALDAERGFLMLVNPETSQLNFPVARNFDRETISGPGFEISQSVVLQVTRSGEALLTSNAQMDPRIQSQQSIVNYKLRSILCVPLVVKDQVTGVIYADNRMKTGVFSDTDKDFLISFAHMAAIAIENARLFNRVQSNLADTNRLKVLMDNIFDSVASGVVTVDAAGRITMINRAALQMMNLPREGIVGSQIEETIPWLVAHPVPDMLARVIGGGEDLLTLPLSVKVAGRGEMNFKVAISRLSGGTAGSVVIALEDQTQEQRLRLDRERETQAKNHLQGMLQRYLSPTIAGRLADSPDSLKLGGERQEITILFADLRGFTSLAEYTPPEELVQILNRYLGLAVREIFRQEGTLDKFLGDAIMAIFNAPLRQPDHIERALRAAIAIQRSVRECWVDLPEEFHLNFGIGINVGEAVVGNIGSHERMEYTAVGDSVNVAERLEEVAKPGQILIAYDVYERTKELIDIRSPESVPMRGRQTHILAYDLLDVHPHPRS